MNVNKTIKDLRGEEYKKSFPTEKEVKESGDDKSKLPRETIGNVIINCLAGYTSKDKRDGFYINLIAQSVIGADKDIELKEKLKIFLIKALEDMILTIEKVDSTDKDGVKTKKDQFKGLYASWVISQVLIELGVKGEEE